MRCTVFHLIPLLLLLLHDAAAPVPCLLVNSAVAVYWNPRKTQQRCGQRALVTGNASGAAAVVNHLANALTGTTLLKWRL